MKKRIYFLSAVLLAFGIVVHASPRAASGEVKTEEWLEKQVPRNVAGYSFAENENYRLDEAVYKELNPFGIIVRIYSQGSDGYDTLFIASNRKESFHDQRVCFTAQGWTLVSDRLAYVESKKRGKVPVSLIELSAPGRGKRFAVLFYKGPGGFYANPRGLAWAMFREQLWFWQTPNLDSVFYRIIPTRSETTEQELLTFTGNLLDAAYESSKGYF